MSCLRYIASYDFFNNSNLVIIRLVSFRRLSKYSGRYQWLRDDRFLKDLEGDSVDTEILDEELRSLDEQQPKK